jgi:hemerythrin
MACRKLIGYRLTNSPNLVKVTFLAIGSRLSADKNLLPARVLMTIEWKDHYKIGDPVIDAQHEELFRLGNQFITATGKAAQTQCAMLFYKHTREHFEYEEALMRRVNYPDMATQVALHNDLISRLNTVSQRIADGDLNMKELQNLITHWTLQHILHEDGRLIGYVTAHLEAQANPEDASTSCS